MNICPACTHYSHDGTYCGGWTDTDPSEPLAYPCVCSFPDSDNYESVPDRRDPEDGTIDQWWLPTGEGDALVNELVLGVAHHHATNHDAGGGGGQFSCEGCDFFIEDGIVQHGGWVRFKAPELCANDGSVS